MAGLNYRFIRNLHVYVCFIIYSPEWRSSSAEWKVVERSPWSEKKKIIKFIYMSDLQNIRAMWLKWDELNSAKDFKTNLSKSYFLQDKPKVCMPMKSGKMLARLQLLQLVYQPILLKRTWSYHLTRKSNSSKRIQKKFKFYKSQAIYNSLSRT